jgi:hypothetical protein
MSLEITTTTASLVHGQGNLVQLGASGATGVVEWTLLPGSTLPPGCAFTSDGHITGTPTTTGIFDVIVSALDLGPTPIAPVTPAVSGTVALTVT